jgi:uncharacterized SAM-binding protein YcdF (DUF218 family)
VTRERLDTWQVAVPERKSRGVARVIAVVATLVVTLVAVVGAVGAFVLTRAPDDTVSHADAIIVLGGEHDGREMFGIVLAKQLSARAVVFSDPYWSNDPVMHTMCAARQDGVQVICEMPTPSTTRGEAQMVRRLATEHGWHRIVVVTWQYHLVRARYIFSRCEPIEGGTVDFVAVQRPYDMSVAVWQYMFFYQVASLGKAALQGGCP